MIKYKITIAAVIFCLASPVMAQDSAKIKTLEDKVEALEKRIAAIEAATSPVVEKINVEQKVSEQRLKARERMRLDLTVYSAGELREIESLYQVANQKWKSQQGKDSLKLLIEKYDKANRTGCALLYLGQMSTGDERENYLLEAIDDFSDCYYGDGVQVGAYARYFLAYHYKEVGEKEKEELMLKELKSEFPDAISHKGKMLSELIKQ